MTELRGTAKSASGAVFSSVLQGQGIAPREDVSTTILFPKNIPSLSELRHARRPCLNSSQSLRTLGRGLLIYPNDTVWTVTWLIEQRFDNVSPST